MKAIKTLKSNEEHAIGSSCKEKCLYKVKNIDMTSFPIR